MKANALVEQDFKIWWLLAQVRHLMHQARENELSPYGITAIQAAILLIIDTIDSTVTTSEIARWFMRKPHTIGALLNRMEKQGLITKTKDTKKHNRFTISLTEKGRQCYSQSRKRESIRAIMSCLSKEELNQLESSLAKLRDVALAHINTPSRLPFP